MKKLVGESSFPRAASGAELVMRKRSPSTRLVGVLTKAAEGSTVRRADHGRAAPVESRVKLEEANRSGGQHMRKVAFWVSGHAFKDEKASRRLLVLSKANASARVDSSKTAARGSVRVVFTDCPGSKLCKEGPGGVEALRDARAPEGESLRTGAVA